MNKLKDKKGEKIKKSKRFFAAASIAVFVLTFAFLTYITVLWFDDIASSGVSFDEFIKGYGAFGIFVALGLQVLQVFVALIPGEFLEIGMGFTYGWFLGTILCLGGVAIGSSMIFLLVKRFGMRALEIFLPLEKINELGIISNEHRFKRLTFIIFFLPGTPKDLLTYFLGLTRMTLGEFLAITLAARIPTVASSTIGGNLIGEGEYVKAVILFVIIGIISLAGLKLYTVLMQKIRQRAEHGTGIISKLANHNKDRN